MHMNRLPIGDRSGRYKAHEKWVAYRHGYELAIDPYEATARTKLYRRPRMI